jgi:pimeloyl-ACP methyl ester carboxylesterase
LRADHRPVRVPWTPALFLVAAGGVAIAAAYRRDLARETRRVETGSRMAATACGPIEYAVRGEGPPLLLVHGAGGGYDQGLELGAALVARGVRVVTMSRFGYLRTPLPADASPASQADAHACLLDALEVARVAIVGASAGAPSALQFALRHPQRTAALVLLVPAAANPQGGGGTASPALTQRVFDTALRSDLLYWLARKLAPGTLIEALLATPPSVVAAATPAEQARVARILAHIEPVSRRANGLLNDAQVLSTLRPEPLERVTVPTLILSVEDDLFGTAHNARRLAAGIAGARLRVWPQGGHMWVGHDAEVTDAIATFALENR